MNLELRRSERLGRHLVRLEGAVEWWRVARPAATSCGETHLVDGGPLELPGAKAQPGDLVRPSDRDLDHYNRHAAENRHWWVQSQQHGLLISIAQQHEWPYVLLVGYSIRGEFYVPRCTQIPADGLVAVGHVPGLIDQLQTFPSLADRGQIGQAVSDSMAARPLRLTPIETKEQP